MQRKHIIAAGAALLVIVAAGWMVSRAKSEKESPYRFATVERGDLEAAVSATGKLGAVTTVQVGTQVSGQVSAIHVDFNDRVRKGQLIARIDPTLQQQAVRDALAGLERVQAERAQALREYNRNKQLFDRKVLTEAEFNNAQYGLAIANASVKSAQVTLDRARQNLSYTSIHAPIDGIVIERNVDVGQTVAASLSAPQLFLIANNLSRMQILASVDESDIGLIKDGQEVRFSVQAYPDENFRGTVRQVRLQSVTQENVVNYTAVVEVDNASGKLLPGMTATVDFLTGAARNVLLVPNAALRFRPTAEMQEQVRGRLTSSRGGDSSRRGGRDSSAGGSSDSARRAQFIAAQRQARAAGDGFTPGAPAGGGAAARRAAGPRPNEPVMLWTVDKDGQLSVVRVRAGLSDGQKTEVRGEGLSAGMQVIVGVTQNGGAASGSPFQAQQQTGPRPGGF
ncbi:MAG: efflux RND transporter periplasmic adaptor subunit [Thermoanaerobaculia bacterium]